MSDGERARPSARGRPARATTRATSRPTGNEMAHPWTHLDWSIAALIGLVTLITRWPLRTSILAYWDSVLYARALDEFNPVAHQPQPPGYLFYVWTARLVRWLGATDTNQAYLWVSQVAAALVPVVVYLLGCRLFGRAAGLAGALFAATAVAPWNYSGVAYPYTLLALLSGLLGALAWELGLHHRPASIGAATRAPAGAEPGGVPPLLAGATGLALGLASGFRQDLVLFLGPLLLVSLGRPAPRRLLAAGVGLTAGGLAWFIPTVIASGGLAPYLSSLGRQSLLVERDTSVTADGWQGLLWNLEHLRLFLIEQTLRWAAVPLAIFLVAQGLGGTLWRDRRTRHLLLWLLPATLFYSLIHLGDVGYVFSLLPATTIAAGAGTVTGARWLGGRSIWRDRALALPVGSLVVTPTLVAWWLLTILPVLENDYVMFHTGRQYSILWQECRDKTLAGSLMLLQERYQPAETLLMAAGYYQQARLYLPEYPAWLYDPVDGPVFRRPVPAGIRQVVAFGFRMQTRNQSNEEQILVGCDNSLSIFRVEPGQVVVYRPDELWIE